MSTKYYLQSKFKSTGTAYLFYFLLGMHYAYLGKWGLQILFWVTLGGFFIWALIDLFTIPGKVNKYNLEISRQLEEIERKEKDDSFAKQMLLAKQIRGK